MKKINLFLLFLIFAIFLSMNTVSAMDNNDNGSNNIVYSSFDVVSDSDVVSSFNVTSSSVVISSYSPSSNSIRNENSNNNQAKSYVNINIKPKNVSQYDIVNASISINNYIVKNKKLPNYVTINNYKFSMPEFIYLLSKTVEYKYKNVTSNIIIKYGLKNPPRSRGESISGNFSSKQCYKYALRIIEFITNYNVVPNNVETYLGKMQYQTAIFMFVKILSTQGSGNLPETIFVNVKKNSELNKKLPNYIRPGTNTKNVLNNKYKIGTAKYYLSATKNCQVNDKKIKKLAKFITKKYKSRLQKAIAIYDWVMDKVEYKFYYNTKYGAKKTLSTKKGNCVDKSHLLVALCRASKIPSRYVYGNCKFVSGSWIGHVWTQILIGKKWIVADPSHYSLNGFGIVNNWDPYSYDLYGRSSQIGF
ncbi:transglutaminase-like superfamily protein [Methanobrevibacter cuticularis]|uniref:Transglutaminase-like superfamily protein n=1 Tax=Methanobrevibacter cuticularis TaxID=47311 RepID=A0A166EPQ4_9EURY|nr:transglutaminase-like domain-containing protein [Methanobrevibacter cuticularis]KZX16876.1 transglutaminase-like superfamily protein [Methanobrevibacter cuticularis]